MTGASCRRTAPRGCRSGWRISLGCVTSSAELAPGSGLLLYTDGLTEARRAGNGDPRGLELFGEDRVSAAVSRMRGMSSVEVVQHLREEVQTFSGGKLADDLCLLALRASDHPDTTEVC